MVKKKRRKLRIGRVLILLIIIILIIFAFKLISYISYNNKVYNKVYNGIINSKDTISIDKKYSKLKLYNKTISLIKENNISLKIKYKKYSITIPSDNIKKNMSLKVNTYNKKLDYDDFTKTKSYFIDNTGIVKKSSKIKLELPKYLYKNGVVDVYAVKDDVVSEISLSIKTDGTITFNTNSKYDKYFVTFIKLEDIQVSNLQVKKGDIVNLNITYVPSNATNVDIEYTKIGDIFMLNDENKIIAVNDGTGKIKIREKNTDIKKTIKVTVSSEERQIETIDGITYVDGILIVNKTYSLPEDYDPGGLDEEALNAFYEMREDAAEDDITLWIQSGYRSYTTQQNLYNKYVSESGQDVADTFSARAGHSEHQTGLAMDLNIIDSSFEGTKEAIWIEENCYKYGFIIRYPKGKESITGYKYEPWHIRYLGKDLAKEIYESGLTLEEYLGIDSKYSN